MINHMSRTVYFSYGANVDSSFIEWLGYDVERSELYLTYEDRRGIRVYRDVPEDEFFHLAHSNSVGAYYNRNIRGAYSTWWLDNYTPEFDHELCLDQEPESIEPANGGLVTVGYTDETALHLKSDGTLYVRGNLSATELNISHYHKYVVDFVIGGEVGSFEVHSDSVEGALRVGSGTLHSLNVGFEITGVRKV